MITSEVRKQKGRDNRERIAAVQQNKRDGEYELYHIGETPTGPRMPKNQREMQMHLSGRYTETFREPITRSERREWDKFWKAKGPGYTKPLKKGERF